MSSASPPQSPVFTKLSRSPPPTPILFILSVGPRGQPRSLPPQRRAARSLVFVCSRLAYRIRHESPGFRAVVNGVVAFLTLALGLDHTLFRGLGSVLLQARCRANHLACSDYSLIQRSHAASAAALAHHGNRGRHRGHGSSRKGSDHGAANSDFYSLALSGLHRSPGHGPRV